MFQSRPFWLHCWKDVQICVDFRISSCYTHPNTIIIWLYGSTGIRSYAICGEKNSETRGNSVKYVGSVLNKCRKLRYCTRPGSIVPNLVRIESRGSNIKEENLREMHKNLAIDSCNTSFISQPETALIRKSFILESDICKPQSKSTGFRWPHIFYFSMNTFVTNKPTYSFTVSYIKLQQYSIH